MAYSEKGKAMGGTMGGPVYTQHELDTGRWVRELAAESPLGMRAFYQTREWKQLRQSVLKRDKNACVRCRSMGRYTKAVTVHHVKHLKEAPELALAADNLMSLCEPCHKAVHPENQAKGRGFRNRERW